MKPLTEQDLRQAWPGTAPVVLTVPPGTPITSAAREYLRRRRVKLVFDSQAPAFDLASAFVPESCAAERPDADSTAPRPFVGPDGGFFDRKPESLTHLRGRHLVRKDHPVIVWRGRLDSFCAHILEAQVLGRRENRQDFVEELREILDFCRRLLKAEFQDLAVEDFRLLGLTPGDLRERSHHPDRFFGLPHILMSCDMGILAATLNALRAEVREVETAAVAAFGNDGAPRRDDLILAFNRLSSLFYIMVYRYLPKNFQPERAGI